jgi:hypothetical protein
VNNEFEKLVVSAEFDKVLLWHMPAGIEIYYAKCQSGKIVPGLRV